MAKLKLTLAIDRYDFLQPIARGEVEAKDLDIQWITEGSKHRHDRMYHGREFDACEFSMAGYIVARARGLDWMQAIPYFSRRMFAHHYCFVRAGSGIARPADLRGRRIGIRTYENSLAVAAKGMFAHDYGLPLESVTWVCINNELVGTHPPSTIRVEQIEQGRKLEDLLVAGEIDASVEPELPKGWLSGDGKLARLFPEFERDEREYYRRTRVFPLMHPIVVKKELLDAEPWVAQSLYDALCDCQRRWRSFMQQPHHLSFAWAASYVEREQSFFGGDPFVQGLRANHHGLKTMIAFCGEQGMLDGPVAPEDLFPSTMKDT